MSDFEFADNVSVRVVSRSDVDDAVTRRLWPLAPSGELSPDAFPRGDVFVEVGCFTWSDSGSDFELDGNSHGLRVWKQVQHLLGPTIYSFVVELLDNQAFWTAFGASLTAFCARHSLKRIHVAGREIVLRGYGRRDAERIIAALRNDLELPSPDSSAPEEVAADDRVTDEDDAGEQAEGDDRA